MKKLHIKRLSPDARYKGSWRWFYVAYGDWQPFKRFGHGGWICLSHNWLWRFWDFDKTGTRPERAKSSN